MENLFNEIKIRFEYFLMQNVVFENIHLSKEQCLQLQEYFSFFGKIEKIIIQNYDLKIIEEDKIKESYFSQNKQFRQGTFEQLNDPKIGLWNYSIILGDKIKLSFLRGKIKEIQTNEEIDNQIFKLRKEWER